MKLLKKAIAVCILAPVFLMFILVKLLGDLVPWAIKQIDN